MSYLWTGYVLTWAALAWFAWRLERRAAGSARRLEETSGREARGTGSRNSSDEEPPPAPGGPAAGRGGGPAGEISRRQAEG